MFELIGSAGRGKTCPAIDGIIEEGSEILSEYKGAPAVDAGLVACARRRALRDRPDTER